MKPFKEILQESFKFNGIIIEESLKDNRILNNLEIIKIQITNDKKKSDRWHLYEVLISENEIENMSDQIMKDYYAHFWNKDDVIAVFSNKIFKFKYSDKDTWKDVLDYGKKLDIPKEQLDFPITGLK